jgi:hypothetical protein
MPARPKHRFSPDLTPLLQKRMHFYHHVNKVDYAVFDKAAFVAKLPRSVLAVILALEFVMVPAWFFLIKLRAISAPWWQPERRAHRERTAAAILLSLFWFAIMASQRLLSLLAYGITTCAVIQVLRFTDFVSHNYEIVPVGTKLQPRSKEYDQTVTYTLASDRWLWSVVQPVIFLNFSFHNAHHYNTSAKWHELPAVDKKLSAEQIATPGATTTAEAKPKTYKIDVVDALDNFFSTRLQRVLQDPTATPPALKPDGKTLDISGRIGTVDASFLVLEL